MIHIYKPEGLNINQLEFGKQYLVITNGVGKDVRADGDIIMITDEHKFYLRASDKSRYGKSFDVCNVGAKCRYLPINLTTDLTES